MTPAGILTVEVVGLPAPQGSKRGFVVNGRVAMVESSKKVKPWRQDVTAAAQAAAIATGWETPTGPLRVEVIFYMPRPRYHFRTGARAGELKPNAPHYCDKKPDLDKLLRSTCDALTASGAIRDDSQIAVSIASMVYANAATGARVIVSVLDSSPTVAASPTRPAGDAQEAMF